MDLKKLGFNDRLLAVANSYDYLYVGRVCSQHKGSYSVLCATGRIEAEVTGKLQFDAKSLADFPAVGDFVLLDRNTNEHGQAIIKHILPRSSAFIRKAAGTTNNEQVVASNIDKVFICMSLNKDFNLRRLERYLSIVWDSGAMPVVILTKADLCSDLESLVHEVQTVAIGVDILVTSVLQKDGYTKIMQYIKPSHTVAFIGSSGVGKTTLINCLLGNADLATNGLRNYDKGRHTTTRRELIVLENCCILIDTPGMRELGLDSADFSRTFADIEQLSAMYRFANCTHNQEPGCAVQQAILDGRLSQNRLSSYQKLQKETNYEGLNAKQIETSKLNEMFKAVGGMKNARKFIKNNNNHI